MKTCCILFLIAMPYFLCAQSHIRTIDFNQLNLQFEDASSTLKPEYSSLIYRLADTLIKSPQLTLTIRGHVCCVNRNGLAKKRAKVVRNYLLYFGVPKQQMTTIGMKNKVPVVFPEKTKEDELTNMRVDFILK